MTKEPKVSVVLLNYNGYEDTIECLKSLQKTQYTALDIVVVDNNSTNNSIQEIECFFEENNIIYNSSSHTEEQQVISFTLINSGQNGGYGHGNNVGIKHALTNGADYVLVLNNDTIVEPGFLQPLVDLCEKDPSIGIASSNIFFHDSPDKIWFHGGDISPHFCKVIHSNFNEKYTGQVAPVNNTFISGCLWLIPRKVIEDVGYINEEYFMYVEDVEFCHRVISKNYSLRVCNKSIIYHKAGGSTGGHESAFSVYWSAKNGIKFIAENIDRKLPAYFYAVVVKSLRFLYKREIILCSEHLKGIFHGFFKLNK